MSFQHEGWNFEVKNTPESDGGAVLLLSCNKLVIAVYESTRFRKYTTTPTSVWK